MPCAPDGTHFKLTLQISILLLGAKLASTPKAKHACSGTKKRPAADRQIGERQPGNEDNDIIRKHGPRPVRTRLVFRGEGRLGYPASLLRRERRQITLSVALELSAFVERGYGRNHGIRQDSRKDMEPTMEPFISVVIPAYNAAGYIVDTLDNICSQSMRELEIIVVDDGSTDDTGSLLEEYGRRDPRVRVLTVENGGPAAARNQGLSLVRGQYVLFVDSDDRLEPDALTLLRTAAERERPDMLIFGFHIRNIASDNTFSYFYKDVVLGSTQEIREHFPGMYRHNVLNQVWNKLYAAAFLREKELTFPDYHYGEDRLFVLDSLKAASRVTVMERCLYDYYIRPGESLVTRFYDKKFEVCCLIDEKIREFVAASHEESAAFRYMFMKSVVSCLVNLFGPSCPYGFREKRRQAAAILRHPQVREQVHFSRKNGLVGNLLCLLIRTRWTLLNMAAAWLIAKTSRLLPTLFIRVKHPEAVKEEESAGA